MGRKLTPDEEVRALKDATREAHEAAQALSAVIREARALEPGLVAQFEAIAEREIQDLANHLQAQMNEQDANLNAAVDQARKEILFQLTATEMVVDKQSNTVRLLFNSGRFDDQIPLPYPNTPPKEDHQ